ncbi:hypothetical protein QDR37_13785 [Amnibacterium sp. CER49]|uniref:hypothetical protein n=1 Tax=Amnibacterium sp. CER49 TaxID=3039161 RepID=UPI00244CA655|nr:hypothetical protein [Amnibacterium sp. CER49]MDH2445020.1 hypothetical protein [Amnibacterium sp. CER49]
MTDRRSDPAPTTPENDGATHDGAADDGATRAYPARAETADDGATRAYPAADRRHDDATTVLPERSAVAAGGDARSDSPRTDPVAERLRVLEREREEFGGMRFWTAFFGWLTATGMTVLLIAAVGAVAALFGAQNLLRTSGAQTAGIASAVALVVILFVGYYCGGYVAGRMARFSGAKQGLAVWLWAVIIAVLLGIVGAVAGTQASIVGQLGSIPNLPLSPSTLTAAGVVTAAVVLVVMLIGALLGGLAGMRYHRRVDRAGLAAS